MLLVILLSDNNVIVVVLTFFYIIDNYKIMYFIKFFYDKFGYIIYKIDII